MPFTITIPIVEKYINTSKWSIVKNSEEKAIFIKDLTSLPEASIFLLYWISLVLIKLLMILLKQLKLLGRKI